MTSVFDAGTVFREYIQVHGAALLQKAAPDHKLAIGSSSDFIWSKNVRDLALIQLLNQLRQSTV